MTSPQHSNRSALKQLLQGMLRRPALIVLSFSLFEVAPSQSFSMLPLLSSDIDGRANAVSGDGRNVCGFSAANAGPLRAVAWNRASTVIGLGPFAAESMAIGISANGAFVVGRAKHPGPDEQAFRQKPGKPFAMLGYLAANTQFSSAQAVSDHGSVVFGQSLTMSGVEPIRHSGNTISSLGILPGLGNLPQGHSTGTNSTGSVAVGWFEHGVGKKTAFVWNGTLSALKPIMGNPDSVATGMNREGTKAYGYSINSAGQLQGCIWSSPFTGFPSGTGHPLGYKGSAINGGTCSVFGGFLVTNAGAHDAAFQGPMTSNYWQTVKGFLASKGTQLPSGITLEQVTAVSADGTTLVGYGRDAAQHLIPWRARLTPDSELFPSAVSASGVTTTGSVYNLALLDLCFLSLLQHVQGPYTATFAASPPLSQPTTIKMFVAGQIPWLVGGSITVQMYNWKFSAWNSVSTHNFSSQNFTINAALWNPKNYVFNFFGVPIMFGKITMNLYGGWFSSPVLHLDRFGWDIK